MNTFDQEKYDGLKKAYTDVAKKIQNYDTARELPTDVEKRAKRIKQYCEELVTTYNNFIVYAETFFDSFDLPSKFKINEVVAKYKEKLKSSLKILDLEINIPENFELVGFDSIRKINPETETIENIDQNQSLTNSFGERVITSTPTTAQSSLLTGERLNNSEYQNNHNEDAQTSSNSKNPIVSQTEPQLQNNIFIQQNQGNNDLPQNIFNFQNQNEIHNPIMALSVSDILNGIPDFDPKSQESIKKFIAQVDLMNTLSTDNAPTILQIAKARLVTANKLSSVTNKTWAQIKADINEKYRTQISFEVAQEKLLSVQQGPKESHDAYANRLRSLLDSLNSATINDNAEIQNANRNMNENLAIRKFKQNIFDRELRTIAISAEHTTLADAIAHATTKHEQLRSSNVDKKENDKKESEKKEPENEKNKNFNKQHNFKNNKNGQSYNRNKNNADQCTHCKKTNHQSDQCIFRPGGPGYTKNNNNDQKQAQTKSSNTAAAIAQPNEQNIQSEPVATTSSVAPQQAQSMVLQPYHYLNC